MRLVVTGSEGFVGRALVAECARRNIQVTRVDAVGSEDGVCHALDVASPEIEAVIPEGADAVVHLAAVSRHSDCERDPAEAFRVNVGGTLQVARAARNRKVRQFVFASSEWVYGEALNGDPQTEDAAIDIARLDSLYAVTKLAAERALLLARGATPPAVTILRFAIVYGPRSNNWSAVEAIFNAVRTRQVVEIRGSLKTARRYIYVSDLVAGILAAVGRSGHDTFNLSGDRLVTIDDVIREGARLLGVEPKIRALGCESTSIRNPDNGRARAVLGWSPIVALGDGLAKIAGYFASAGYGASL